MDDFSLLKSLDVTLRTIGNEQETVLIVDRVLRDPSALVEYAATKVEFKPAWGPGGGYPGIRAPAPLNYVNKLVRTLDPLIRSAFSLETAKLARAECNFSMVVLDPKHLTPLQRIPHVDTFDSYQLALLHYLCDASMGGTAFYRHLATGFETLSDERWPTYETERRREMANSREAKDYIRGDTEFYGQTAAFDASFDRVILYRSRALHSGQIPKGARLPTGPREGRLTANIFINYKA